MKIVYCVCVYEYDTINLSCVFVFYKSKYINMHNNHTYSQFVINMIMFVFPYYNLLECN